LEAICQHHRINPSELKGWLKCRDLPGSIKIAEFDDRGRRQVGPLDGIIRRAIERSGYKLVIFDPFVKLHALQENDNIDMDFVCVRLIKIAQDLTVAIDSPAHTHKGAIVAGDADARRGGTAQRDAGRLDYTLIVMTEDEATRFGIHPDERKRYMRLDKAKANIVRSSKAIWFHLVNVPIGNATDEYPDGDEMQAIERWNPPETWQGVEPETLNAILDAIDRGTPDGRRYSDHHSAGDRAVWEVVQAYCSDKPQSACKDMIKSWIKEKVLFRDKYLNPVRREEEQGLYVDPLKRPKYGTQKGEN
jgi:hypothetical protein